MSSSSRRKFLQKTAAVAGSVGLAAVAAQVALAEGAAPAAASDAAGENLNAILEQCARDNGADFFGIADLSSVRESLYKFWPLRFSDLKYGISMGMKLNNWIVNRLPTLPNPAIEKLYSHDCYNVVNDQLDWIAVRVAATLQRKGFQAAPIAVTVKVDDEELLGIFSHKAVGHLAGLGWIGKSCLLVTPQVGPRVRWVSVLTDAPLTVTGKPMDRRCGKCQQCVDACPVHAFTGVPFDENDPVAARFDVRKCQAHCKKVKRCGLCLAVCPLGAKGKLVRHIEA